MMEFHGLLESRLGEAGGKNMNRHHSNDPSVTSLQQDWRQDPRVRAAIPAEGRVEGTNVITHVVATKISLGGCWGPESVSQKRFRRTSGRWRVKR
jgi:hypothetical protein